MMETMQRKYGLLIGWGIVIYAVMFLLWSGFVTYGFVDGFAPRILGLLVLIVTALIAGNSLRFNTWRDILPFSLTWGITVAALDGVFGVPLSGWQLYADWNVWFGYALVVIVPLFSPFIRFEKLPTRIPGI